MKTIKPDYVAFYYNSSLGYSLLIQSSGINVRAIFSDADAAQEYLQAKAGKVIAKGFTEAFEEVRQLIVKSPDICREIISKSWAFNKGRFAVNA